MENLNNETVVNPLERAKESDIAISREIAVVQDELADARRRRDENKIVQLSEYFNELVAAREEALVRAKYWSDKLKDLEQE